MYTRTECGATCELSSLTDVIDHHAEQRLTTLWCSLWDGVHSEDALRAAMMGPRARHNPYRRPRPHPELQCEVLNGEVAEFAAVIPVDSLCLTGHAVSTQGSSVSACRRVDCAMGDAKEVFDALWHHTVVPWLCTLYITTQHNTPGWSPRTTRGETRLTLSERVGVLAVRRTSQDDTSRTRGVEDGNRAQLRRKETSGRLARRTAVPRLTVVTSPRELQVQLSQRRRTAFVQSATSAPPRAAATLLQSAQYREAPVIDTTPPGVCEGNLHARLRAAHETYSARMVRAPPTVRHRPSLRTFALAAVANMRSKRAHQPHPPPAM